MTESTLRSGRSVLPANHVFRTTRLLVVDDDAEFLDRLCGALATSGYAVHKAQDATTAQILAERLQPSLVLIDLGMPGMEGFELVRSLRAAVRGTTLSVFLMMDKARREDIIQGTAMGVRDFLLKSSLTLDDLVGRINNSLHTVFPAPPAPPAPPSSFRDSRSSANSSSSNSRLSGPSSWGTSTSVPPSEHSFGDTLEEPAKRFHLRTLQESRCLHTTVSESLRLLASNTASLAQVQTVVRRDPVLTERIMTASSAIAVRGTGSVETLEEAMRALGAESLARLVGSMPVLDEDELSSHMGLEIAQCWSHGIATATFAERLAPASERSGAFLHGLLLALPSILALQSIGDEWLEISLEARRNGQCGFDALALAFGMPANVFAETIFARTSLADAILSPVREWYRNRNRRGSKAASDACRRLDAASSLATSCGYAWGGLSCLRPLTNEESRLWSAADRLDLDMPALLKSVQACLQAAGLPEPPNESVLGGLWGSDNILYWRDPRFRGPDPIELALVELKVKRIDSPDLLLGAGETMGVVCTEPGSPWWSAFANAQRQLVVIHCGSLPPTPPREGIRYLQAPVPLYLLHEAVQDD